MNERIEGIPSDEEGMGRADERATFLRDIYGVVDAPNDDALVGIADDLGLTVEVSPHLTVLRELYFDDTVVIAAGQARPWRRWLLGHVIGHRVLHSGDQFNAADRASILRQEAEADRFAGVLLFGHAVAAAEATPTWAIAELADVPQECVERWWAHEATRSPRAPIAPQLAQHSGHFAVAPPPQVE